MVAAERAGLPPAPLAGHGGRLLSEQPDGQDEEARPVRRKLVGLARRVDGHPLLLGLSRAARRRLPGDHRFGDPLSLGDEPPGMLGQRLAVVAAERPSVLKELGFSALQVWQGLSEAQGRGRGDQEVAILFTDLVGFSKWALDAGDTMTVELLRRVSRSVEPEITRCGGRVVKRLGDGLMAVFDSPERAVEAALACRDAAASVEVGGHAARLRAGVHVGRPRALGGDYLGVDVNIAARVAQAAGAGEVLVSDVVRERLGEGLRVRRKWRFSGKGTPAGMKAFSVE